MDESNVPMGASGTIYAVSADVDGTLVTKKKVLTKRAIEAVRRLHEHGIAGTQVSVVRSQRYYLSRTNLKEPGKDL